MAGFSESTDAELFKCNTCKAAFSSTEKVKEHYKGDWHILNSKRRAGGLLPLKKDEFKLLAKSAKAKEKSSSNASLASLATNKKQSQNDRDVSDLKAKFFGLSTSTSNPETEQSGLKEGAGGDMQQQQQQRQQQQGEEQQQQQEEKIPKGPPPPPKLGANVSIFDDKEFETTEECLQYMCTTFGFFIPDIEYLADLDGLLGYLGEKVKCGGFCLYCQKAYLPGRSTQNHMIDKSHCKLAYDDEIDGDEYDEFYDFSASYEDVDDDELEMDEDGNIVEKEMRISHLGELVLPNGTTVGHRDFRIYYKQYHRPEDTRPAVLAQQREELLRLGYKFGSGPRIDPDTILEMSDTDVMVQLVKYQKEIRRGQIVEQRYQQRAQQRSQKGEYKSNVQKLKSGQNKTAIIRDYHSRLM